MSQASVPAPSIKLTSFACPVCGAHSAQTWFDAYLRRCGDKNPIPHILTSEELDKHEAETKKIADKKDRAPMEGVIRHFRRILDGDPFIDDSRVDIYNAPSLSNIFVSSCYTCNKISIWLHDRLLYPP